MTNVELKFLQYAIPQLKDIRDEFESMLKDREIDHDNLPDRLQQGKVQERLQDEINELDEIVNNLDDAIERANNNLDD